MKLLEISFENFITIF